MTIEDHTTEAGLQLPAPSTPGGNYSSFNIRGNTAHIAIQFPIKDETFLFQGRLGDTLNAQDGYDALQLCAMNVLAQINRYLSFNQLEGMNHLDIYYQSTNYWDEGPYVANGASDLFVEVLKEKGEHTRSILGVHSLPRNFSVGLTATATIKKKPYWFSFN